ncbi:FixH protein [Gelidibacter algens]|uniref:FixH protein n=1 Tax=Gelidibacter algens TaxID=49280 RepID=A0A1A7R1B2_9FLAO|nr:FixH family protein [Gelidibacter algens]OBX25611.1 cytochrome C oxidase Cbb3 [Gelidibacter algens]RAJ27845.1 FixH protein [Gelidibacter algens]
MKFNWGTGIVLAFIGFISFILYFVISMTINKKYEHDMVTENYYKQELQFENELNKQRNAQALEEDITYTRADNGIVITFPENMNPSDITGKVFLYRPSSKQLDFESIISLSDHNLLIPDKRLVGGRWNIKVDWQYNGNSYIFKKDITY